MSTTTTSEATAMRSVKHLEGYRLGARDGDLGKVQDCCFDDQFWVIRYLIADTSRLFGREVMLYTDSLGVPDWADMRIPVDLTQEQVKDSPSVDLDKPVSRQHVLPLHQYYGWPLAWDVAPGGSGAIRLDSSDTKTGASKGDPHLRSAGEVTGYGIVAKDGEIGHVEDFIVEIGFSWSVRYAVIDTRNWLPGGRKVLIAPAWIEKVDWPSKKVHVGLTREAIKKSPPFDATQPVNREYESKLYDYYGRPVYWS
jgi:hypothetical protein